MRYFFTILVLVVLLSTTTQASNQTGQIDKKAREMAKGLVVRFKLGERQYIQIKGLSLQYLKGEMSLEEYQEGVLNLLSGENAKLYAQEIQKQQNLKIDKSCDNDMNVAIIKN